MHSPNGRGCAFWLAARVRAAASAPSAPAGYAMNFSLPDEKRRKWLEMIDEARAAGCPAPTTRAVDDRRCSVTACRLALVPNLRANCNGEQRPSGDAVFPLTFVGVTRCVTLARQAAGYTCRRCTGMRPAHRQNCSPARAPLCSGGEGAPPLSDRATPFVLRAPRSGFWRPVRRYVSS